MQAGTAQAKTLAKAVYLFSVTEDGKVTHLNFLPKSDISKTFTAKTWIGTVSAIIGGKVSQDCVHVTQEIPSDQCPNVTGWRKR